MRRQRHRTGRAVKQYFCIITDTVPSVAGYHGGEVQGTWVADRGTRKIPADGGCSRKDCQRGDGQLIMNEERFLSFGRTTGSQRELDDST